jgi:hypothetical protein
LIQEELVKSGLKPGPDGFWTFAGVTGQGNWVRLKLPVGPITAHRQHLPNLGYDRVFLPACLELFSRCEDEEFVDSGTAFPVYVFQRSVPLAAARRFEAEWDLRLNRYRAIASDEPFTLVYFSCYLRYILGLAEVDGSVFKAVIDTVLDDMHVPKSFSVDWDPSAWTLD